MPLSRLPFLRFRHVLALLLALAPAARPATVLVLEFHNNSKYADLAWVGESIAETLKDELSSQGQITFGREARREALRRLDLRSGADYTKATLIRLGQSLDADFICYGTFDATLPAGENDIKRSTIQISAHFLDLRKLHEGPDVSEAGKLVDLARVEEHLAWQSLKYLDPEAHLPVDKFLVSSKLIRVEAEESYVRGLLSSNKDQQRRWFTQALALDSRFGNPAYELGMLALERKDYRQATGFFGRISNATDPLYPQARFKMGLAYYGAADYASSAHSFRELVKAFPMNEVFNNLGAADDQLNGPSALDEFRHAVEGDRNDPVYLFNLGNKLLKQGNFDEGAEQFKNLLSHSTDDAEAKALLERAQRRDATLAGPKAPAPYRLKTKLDIAAFQQLKAVVQAKGSE